MLSRTPLALVAILVLALTSNFAACKPHKKYFSAKPSRKYKAKNPTQTFCSAFNAQCYLSAVQYHQSTGGSGGDVQVVHACRRNGKKYSKSFSFGCKADGADITQQVLDQIGGGYTITTTATGSAVTGVTSTVTTPYSVTATAPTATETTFVSTSTTVTTTYTATSTQVVLGTDLVPIVTVAVPIVPSPRRKRADVVDPSQFCSAFSAGCVKECARVSSTPKHTICQAGAQQATTLQYKLACYCKNHKVETQHALKDTVNQEHVATVSTIATSTSVFTATASTPTTVATTTPKTTKSATTTTTKTTSLISTTKIVIGATGAVQVINGPDSTSLGYLRSFGLYELYGTDTDKDNAQSFLAVRDPNSGLYSLQHADTSGYSAIAEIGNTGNGNFGSGSSNYAGVEPQVASNCQAASTKANAPDGNGEDYGNPCEVFVFGAQADAQTLTQGGTLDLTFNWVNPGQTAAQQFVWVYGSTYNSLFAGGDATALANLYPGDNDRQVTLRFGA